MVRAPRANFTLGATDYLGLLTFNHGYLTPPARAVHSFPMRYWWVARTGNGGAPRPTCIARRGPLVTTRNWQPLPNGVGLR